MTHVLFRSNPAEPDVFDLIVDGHDLTMAVLRDGFKVELCDEGARVTMVIAADVLEMDLPGSVLAAMREQEKSGDCIPSAMGKCCEKCSEATA